MPSLSEARDKLVNQCAMWCRMTGRKPTGWSENWLAEKAIHDYITLGKGFRELNHAQRCAIAGLEK